MQIHVRDRILWGLIVGGGIVDNVLAGGSRAYPTGKLYLWTPPKYSKKKYRDLIGRLHREGYVQRVLVEGEVNYRITGAGRKLLMTNRPVLKMDQAKWDGFWRLSLFDVPESKRRARDMLRRYLVSLGFGRLQHSTYISPYDHGKSLLDFIQVRGLSGQVLMLESKQKYLGNPKDLAAKVWNLSQLNQSYKYVIEKLTTRFGIKDRLKREQFLKKVYEDYLEVLTTDPLLPAELLPTDWVRGKAEGFLLRAGLVREQT
ncbi:MAG TPA: PaaX family transcriptional regulator C-terminal domain-containing protein [Patescibacteria group bacterium]|nr:PaaX family transcriptional regulator C-terminal domain-containing protein [Patescibacteria group bacterium]